MSNHIERNNRLYNAVSTKLGEAHNAASGWLTVLLDEAGLQVPTTGLAGFLASTSWINVIAYGLVALLLILATGGRLGYQRAEELAPNRAS
jgi:hypothetical protein